MPTIIPANLIRPVNITVVTYNRRGCTRQTLRAIRETADMPYVLNVVDNASTDGTQEALRAMHAAGEIDGLALFRRNMGVACAVNHGWSMTEADHYLRLDNDIVFRKEGWLSTMMRALDRNPELGLIAFPVYRTIGEYKRLKLDSGDVLHILPHACSPGGVSMVPGRVAEAMGCWNEDYGSYGAEDGDYCLRLDLSALVRAYVPGFDWLDHIGHGDANIEDYARKKHVRQMAHRRSGTGLFRLNVYLYENDMRPLKMERKFRPVIERDADGVETVRFSLNPDYAKFTRQLSTLRRILKDCDDLRTFEALRDQERELRELFENKTDDRATA